MKIRKAYKFRLKVSDHVESKLTLFAGHCRFVWNKAWRMNMQRLEQKHRIMRYNELSFWLTFWKKKEWKTLVHVGSG